MGDDFIITCDDIKKRVKPFQQDLLAEKEYKAYVDHLYKCPKCKEYVGSIDFLSNQLWKLGDVKVPSDLSSTILFKLTQAPEQEVKAQPQAQAATSKSIMSEKLILRAVIVVLLGVALFFGIRYFKGCGRSQKIDAPLEVQEIKKKQPLSGRKTKKRFDKETTMMVFGKDTAATTIEEELVVKIEEPRPLHWHFQYSEEGQETILRTGLQIERNLEQKLKEVKKYGPEIKRLEREVEKLDFELTSFTSTDKTSIETKKNEANEKLQGYIKEKARLESLVKNLEEEKYKTENSLRKFRRKEDSRKTDLGRILASSATRFGYQANDILSLAIKSEEIENVLEKVLLISQDSSALRLRDFTKTVSLLPDKEYEVSVYLEKANESVLHWHVDIRGEDQKSELLDIIRERSGYIDYDSEALAVFSIQRTEVQTLKSRILAMRLGFAEFGRTALKKDKLVGGPVTISVYFAKK
ncbi:hypothetical protein ACFL28_05060 [Candidatus Omnitrophota bacterium]